MTILLAMLIAGLGPDVPLENRYPGASTVFTCDFSAKWDENYDHWPDNWTRRRGPGYPHYVNIELTEEPTPTGDQCLKVQLDGGAAVAYTPPIEISPLFSFVLEAYVKTDQLEHDRAYLSITLLDRQRRRLETFYSEKYQQTDGWCKVRLGPVEPISDQARFAVVGLHVQPLRMREDLKGGASFADVWFGRLPRMALRSNKPFNLFNVAEEVEIECTASGLTGTPPNITFRLEDVFGTVLAEWKHPLEAKPAELDSEFMLDALPPGPPVLVGDLHWKPPIPGPGYYRVCTTMDGKEASTFLREIGIAVIEPRRTPAGSRFGWTLPRGGAPIPLPMLNQLIAQAGIGWVKYPFWYADKGDNERIEKLVSFAERLAAQGIELIGLLNDPPETLRTRYGGAQNLTAADIFAPDPKVWYTSLEPVLTRLATRIRWWQLGDDSDTSFIGYPNLSAKISQIKTEMDRVGQDVDLVLGWNWVDALPKTDQSVPPWRALALKAEPVLTYEELTIYLKASQDAPTQRWATLQPLPRDEYSPAIRATDLVRRMIAAKINGAEAIFCPEPFDTRCGLMNDDGTPGELFLPWRTTALLLGGAKFIGSIDLPDGSPNLVFARAKDAVMVIWNDEPVEEVLYLGKNVKQVDLWGHEVQVPQQGHRHVVVAGPVPSFVTGLNEAITRWRMDFQFSRYRLPSVFGYSHKDSFKLKNHFDRGTSGEARLVMPEIWTVDPEITSFRLAAGEEAQQPFKVLLPFNASSGRHAVRIDFDVHADDRYRFSVYRHIDIGMGDVYIEVHTQLNEKGDLEVQQRFVNETGGRVSFRCQLFAAGRRRLKSQVIDVRRVPDVTLYRLPDGQQLLGQTLWLRAEEIDGPRVLNYRFIAKP